MFLILNPIVSSTLDYLFLVNFYISYQNFCLFFQLWDLFPEITLLFFLAFSLVSLLNDTEQSASQYYRWVIYFIIVLLIICLTPSNETTILLSFTLINCWYTKMSKLMIISLTIVILFIAKNKLLLGNDLKCMVELPIVIGFAVLFMLFLTSTYDFFGVYLSLEGLSLTLYVLSGMLNKSVVSIESAIKYFALGSIASGILLFGASYLFGIVGSLDFLEVQLFLSNSLQSFDLLWELKLSILCILLGLFFKLSAFPCHWWVADVYEGVWTPVTAFFAVVVKVSLFLFFFRLMFNVLFSVLFIIQPIILFITIGSMFIGTFGALKQVRIKRFIAYASISQVGFILLGVSTGSLSGLIASFIYLLVYVVMSILFFTLILNTEHIVTKKNIIYLSELYCFSIYSPKFAKYFAVVLFSMAGIPPMGGFVSKLLIYVVAIEAKLDFIVSFSLILSLVSTYYYLNFVHYLWFVKFNVLRLYFFRLTIGLTLWLDLTAIFLLFFIVILDLFVKSPVSYLALSCVWPFIF
jgi:NADH-quinone oxidoreductase subunit N